MSFSTYSASAPAFARALTNLSNILEKGAAFAKDQGIAEADLLAERLAPDMFPLVRQVQIAADAAVRGAARLSGREIPSMPDTETTFAELQARIEKAKAFVAGVPAAELEGAEGRTIKVPLRDGEMSFSGEDFLLGFALPNLYFHVTAAYIILRHKGVALGKADFLGGR